MKPRQPSTGHVKGYCSRLHRVQAPSHPGSCQIVPSRRGGRTPFHAQKRRIIVLMSSPRSSARPSKRSARTTARSVRRTCVRRRRPSPTSFLGALHHWPAKIEEAHGFERQRLQRRAARGSRCVDPYHSRRARTGRRSEATWAREFGRTGTCQASRPASPTRAANGDGGAGAA